MKRLFILTVIVTIMISGCQNQGSMMLTDTSCSPPCWHDIQPGLTSVAVLLNTLPSIPEVKANTIKHEGKTWNVFEDVISWEYQSQSRVNFSWAFIHDGIVEWIEFRGIKGTTVGSLMNKYGTPESVWVDSKGVEVGHSVIALIYLKTGIILGYLGPYCRDSKVGIKIGDNVGTVDFFNPKRFDLLLSAGWHFGVITYDKYKEIIQPWAGFTNYKCQ